MREGFKLTEPHRVGCYAVGDDYPFIVHDGYERKLKRNGNKGGSTMWHRFVCNDGGGCPAVLLVRWDRLAALLKAEASS